MWCDGPVRITRTVGGCMDFTAIKGLPAAIQSWRAGDPVPEALLSVRFDYRRLGGCLPVIGLSGENYVREIENDELLRALLVHPRADGRLLDAALYRVLTTRGLAE